MTAHTSSAGALISMVSVTFCRVGPWAHAAPGKAETIRPSPSKADFKIP